MRLVRRNQPEPGVVNLVRLVSNALRSRLDFPWGTTGLRGELPFWCAEPVHLDYSGLIECFRQLQNLRTCEGSSSFQCPADGSVSIL